MYQAQSTPWTLAAGLLVFLALFALPAFGQIGDEINEAEQRPLSEIEQKFPELQPIKRTQILKPAKPVLVVKDEHKADGELRRLKEERRGVMGSAKASIRVKDRKATMRTVARLERLRLKRLQRMREVSKPVIKRKGPSLIPPGPGEKAEEEAPMPILPMPKLPSSER